LKTRSIAKPSTLLVVTVLLPLALLACGSSASQNTAGATPPVSVLPLSTPTGSSTTGRPGFPATGTTPSGPTGQPPVSQIPDPVAHESSATPAGPPSLTPGTPVPPTQALSFAALAVNSDTVYVGETGHFIKNPFLAYWLKYGAAGVFGNPLSEIFQQNGKEVQLFEQALLEYHPELAGQSGEVQLGFLGQQLAQAQNLSPATPAFRPVSADDASPDTSYFPQTQHTLANPFKTFWEENKLLKFLGYPISQAQEQAGLTVQYFERGRLEYNTATRKIAYSNSGDLLIAAQGWPAPAKFGLEINIPDNPLALNQGQILSVELVDQGSAASSEPPVDLQGKFAASTLKFSPLKKDSSPAISYKALQAIEPSLNPGTYPLTLAFIDRQGIARTITRNIRVNSRDYGSQDLDLAGDLSTLADRSADDYDNAQLNAAYSTFSPTCLWQGIWQWPLKVPWTQVTNFAQQRTFNGKTDTLYLHEGIDMAPNSETAGANVQVAAPGKVIFTGSLKARGLSVAVDHGLGVTSYYFHMSQIDVKVGQTLQGGESVGLVGSTGRSTGPHLHWEVRVNGLISDPRNFLNEDLSR